MSDREGFAARKAASEAKGMKRGFGISMYLECTGGGPKEEAKVSFLDNGKVELSVGSSSPGTSQAARLIARSQRFQEVPRDFIESQPWQTVAARR